MTQTDTAVIIRGVPHVSVFGPLLFLINIRAILKCIEINTIEYADDSIGHAAGDFFESINFNILRTYENKSWL